MPCEKLTISVRSISVLFRDTSIHANALFFFSYSANQWHYLRLYGMLSILTCVSLLYGIGNTLTNLYQYKDCSRAIQKDNNNK